MTSSFTNIGEIYPIAEFYPEIIIMMSRNIFSFK